MQAGTKYARERRRTGWIDPALTETGGEKACAVAALH